MASIRKRTNSSGDVKYTVQVRLKGHPPEVASFERLTDAKRWAQSTEAAIREGRYFKTTIDSPEKIRAEIYDRILVTDDEGMSKVDLEERFSYFGYKYLDALEDLLKQGKIIKVERLVSRSRGKVTHYLAL